MKPMFRDPSAFLRQADALRQQAEYVCETDAELCEVASQVLVGDVYALREELGCRGADGWNGRCYICDLDQDPL